MKASRGHLPQTFTDGIVSVYAEVIKPPAHAKLIIDAMLQTESSLAGIPVTAVSSYHNGVIMQASTNGKTWSYAIRPYFYHNTSKPGRWVGYKAPSSYLPEGGTRRGHQNRSHLESPFRDLVDWAFKDMAKRAKLPAGDPGALQFNVAYDREAPQEVGKRLPGPYGPITYTGYGAKVGAYTLDEIHGTVCNVLTAIADQWFWQITTPTKWRPNNLEIMLHSGQKTLGLAFAPGTGRERNKRTISLNEKLFKLYDMTAVWRVVIHELCHHYRDEAFSPRDVDLATAERLRQSITARVSKGFKVNHDVLNTHDSVFIRELAKVDPKVVDDPYSGIYFVEYADPSLVADAKAAKEKREARIDWNPAAGRVWINRLKDGTFSVYWTSLTDGGFKHKVGPLNDPTMRGLIDRLGKGAGGPDNPQMAMQVLSAAVTYSDRWPSSWDSHPTLLGLVEFLEKRLGLCILARATT